MTRAQVMALPPADARTDAAQGSVLFIGNATLLIRFAGFSILTDPVFVHRHEQVGIGYGLHTTRLTDPAMEIADLPPLDFVLLSHFHGDHFDQVAERELDRDVPIVTTADAAGQLEQRGFRTLFALEKWGALTATKGDIDLTVTAMPGKHGPAMVDFALPDVMGSMLEFRRDDTLLTRMYISGDTLIFDELGEIPERCGDIDLAMLHLGGTEVLGIKVTMNGEDGVRLLEILEPSLAIPIHFDDFDAFKSPLADFEQRVEEAGRTEQVFYLDRGQEFEWAAR